MWPDTTNAVTIEQPFPSQIYARRKLRFHDFTMQRIYWCLSLHLRPGNINTCTKSSPDCIWALLLEMMGTGWQSEKQAVRTERTCFRPRLRPSDNLSSTAPTFATCRISNEAMMRTICVSVQQFNSVGLSGTSICNFRSESKPYHLRCKQTAPDVITATSTGIL